MNLRGLTGINFSKNLIFPFFQFWVAKTSKITVKIVKIESNPRFSANINKGEAGMRFER